MSKHIILIILSVFVNVTPVFTQKYVFDSKIYIHDYQDYKQLQLSQDEETFEKSQNLHSKVNLYYYFENFQITNLSNIRIEIEKTNWTILSNIVSVNEKLDDVEYSLFKSRDDYYLCLRFLPYFINETGNLCQIDSFKLSVFGDTQNRSKKTVQIDVNQSVLMSGNWVKIGIPKDGICKLDSDLLQSYGFNDLSKVRIFGNGFGQLPFMNNEYRPQDLTEISIHEETDGIYFYAKGPDMWKYRDVDKSYYIQKHRYSDLSYYFVTNKPGFPKRIDSNQSTIIEPTQILNSFHNFQHYELDSISLLHSGQMWLGEHFDIDLEHNINFRLDNVDTTHVVNIEVVTAVRSVMPINHNGITVELNNEVLSPVIYHPPVEISQTTNYVSYLETEFSVNVFSNDLNLGFIYNKADNFSEAWLDYVTISYVDKLIFNDDQLHFRGTDSVNISRFEIASEYSDLLIWNITDHFNIKSISTTYSNGKIVFTIPTDSVNEFVAFSLGNSDFFVPEVIGEIQNQNLHGMDNKEMLILTSKPLLQDAQILSDFHNNRGLITEVVLLDEIYNEFSSGMPDVSAIRDFVRYHYLNSQSGQVTLQYLLLFGDGSYDNSSVFIEKNPSTILTYQSKNSILPTGSFVSDDFFGLLDQNEGEAQGLLDIGIGRIPVSNHQEAIIVINKILKYYDEMSLGAWRNNLLFIADDGDFNIHFNQAEFLTSYVDTSNSIYNINKIYFDAYLEDQNSIGSGFPDATNQINNSIENGCLIVNYTGHGSELGLGGERVINSDDILSWTNTSKMNLFMTATCEFSRFDEYDRTTAGELVLLNPKGGSVALFSTTRLVFSTPNFILNQNFFKQVLDKPTNKNRLGDIMMNTKINSGQGNNKRNFTLIGDPALELAIPQHNITITKINNTPVSQFTDTLFALSKVILTGQLIDSEFNLLSLYSGKLSVKVFDQKQKLTTLGNGENESAGFEMFENIIFNGVVNVLEGRFEIVFIIPEDISTAFGNGRVSLYASENISEGLNIGDGHGVFSQMSMTGSKVIDINDNTGPEMEILFDGKYFIEGNLVASSPVVSINLSDSSGINTTGFTIGRNITAQFDNDPSMLFVLNDQYEADVDSYQSGKISFSPGELEYGLHDLIVRAWDVANNLTETLIKFEIIENIDPEINRIFNYPNPFTQHTSFYIEHNYIGRGEVDIQIVIYTISGKIVKTIVNQITCDTDLSIVGNWDGLDDFGNKLGRGVYLYKVSLRNEEGKSVERIEKLVILK